MPKSKNNKRFRKSRTPLYLSLILLIIGLSTIFTLTKISKLSYDYSGDSHAADNPVITYYVSQSGNDVNNGSQSSPWRTLQKAATMAGPGSIVYVAGGTYKEKFSPAKSGTEGSYITYKPVPGETVILDGAGISLTNSPYPEGLITIKGKSYIKIDGFTLKNSSVDGISVFPGTDGTSSHHIEISNLNVLNSHQEGIRAHKSSNIVIKNNNINYVQLSSGIQIWQCDQVLVEGNKIVNAHVSSVPNGGHEESLSLASTTNFDVSYNDVSMDGYPGQYGNEGIDIKEASRNGKVHHNKIHGYKTSGGALYLDAWKATNPSLSNIDVYSNYIYDNIGGITIGSEQGGTNENINVFNNVTYNTSAYGINVSDHPNGGWKKNINIFNNTVYKAQHNGGAGIYISSPKVSGIKIYNNIVYFNKWNGGITAFSPDILSQITAKNNISYHGSDSSHCANNAPNCVELTKNPAGYPSIAGNRIIDPKFVNLSPISLSTAAFLGLQAGSPAIDTGIDLRNILNPDLYRLASVDFNGNIRPQSSGTDIGAFEFGTNQTPRPTATPTIMPTIAPTIKPTIAPTLKPTIAPTIKPTIIPTPTPRSTGSVITIYAAGTPSNGVYPTLDLYIDNVRVNRWSNVKGSPKNRVMWKLIYNSPKKITSPSQIKVAFSNDSYQNGQDRNLLVDRIEIDGRTYQTESSTTYSTGSWNPATRNCSAGYVKSEWLACNGYFNYK